LQAVISWLANLEMTIHQLAGAFVALGKLIQVQILLALDVCENKLQHLRFLESPQELAGGFCASEHPARGTNSLSIA